MRCFCLGKPATVEPPEPRPSWPTMSRISEDQESCDADLPPLAGRQSARHRLVSQRVIGTTRGPSLDLLVKRYKVPGAVDPRMNSEPSTPSEEEVRRFYALYGQRFEPTGRRADALDNTKRGP